MTSLNGKEAFEGRTLTDLCLSRMFVLARIGCCPEVDSPESALVSHLCVSRVLYSAKLAFWHRPMFLSVPYRYESDFWPPYTFSSVPYRYGSAFWQLYIYREFATGTNRIFDSHIFLERFLQELVGYLFSEGFLTRSNPFCTSILSSNQIARVHYDDIIIKNEHFSHGITLCG